MTKDAAVSTTKVNAIEDEQEKVYKICGASFSKTKLVSAGKVLMWIMLTMTITFTPVMMNLSYSKVGGGRDKDKYNPPSANAVSFFSSILISASLATLIEGKASFWRIFCGKEILLLAPVSVGYSVSEVLALIAMASCTPIMYAIIHKMRLLLAAFMTRVFLKRHVSLVQWNICFGVTFTVLAFVLHMLSSTDKENSVKGVILLIINISISVACSIYADFSYKKNQASYIVQMAQGRITAFLGSVSLTAFLMFKNGWLKFGPFGGPGGGWDRWVVMFVCFLIMRDWLTTLNLKVLDALYKSLAGSAAVSTTYVVDSLLYGRPIVPTKLCLVIAIMISVMTYAFVKNMEKSASEKDKKVKDLENKLKEFEFNDEERRV